MRAWVFSDLHLESDPSFKFPTIPSADICLCSGDLLDNGIVPSLHWLAEHVAPFMPVILVPGNHEYYRSSIKEGRDAGYELSQKLKGVHLLDGDCVSVGGYRFIGATLWTDFALRGDPRLAAAHAREHLNDYRRIKLSKSPFKRFSPQYSQYLHRAATGDIDNIYYSQRRTRTVIISHHAPSLMSVPRQLLDDPLTPAFASSYEYRILDYEPLLWVHGHIHAASDYHIGKTRVVCNPLGYPDEPSRKSFIPDLVIDLAKLDRK